MWMGRVESSNEAALPLRQPVPGAGGSSHLERQAGELH